MRNHMASSVLVNGYLYGFNDAKLRCIDFAGKGQVKWTQRGLGKGSLMAADGHLIILSEQGELIIAQATPQAFTPVTRAQVLDNDHGWMPPVLAAGRIYCRNDHGQLVCLDVSE